jgi:flavin-dependent dehydrogenase
MSDQNSLAVIGAGLAGLTCARALADAGLRSPRGGSTAGSSTTALRP